MKKLKIVAILFLIIFQHCNSEDDLNWLRNQEKIDELVSKSVEQVTIDGTTLELQVYLQRDFMPVTPPEGSPLVSVNRVYDVDSVKVPDFMTMDEQYVITGDSIWETVYNIIPDSYFPYILEKRSSGGPLWGPKDGVTVIAKLTDSRSAESYFLMKENQTITATY